MPPKPIGENWLNWSQRLATYLIQVRSQLRQKASEESAAEDGVILWDRSVGYPVVSKSGLFVGFELKSVGYTVSSLLCQAVAQ